MMLSLPDSPSTLTFQIIVSIPQIIQLSLHKLRREMLSTTVLEVLQRSAHSWEMAIPLEGSLDGMFQREEGIRNLEEDRLFEKQVDDFLGLGLGVTGERLFERGGDVIGLDNGALLPDLDDVGEMDVPALVFGGLCDEVETLDVGGHKADVDGVVKFLESLALLGFGETLLLGLGETVHCFGKD